MNTARYRDSNIRGDLPNSGQMYAERQRFALWVYVLVIAILCVAAGAIVSDATRGAGKPFPREIVPLILALFLFLFDVLSLRTNADRECMHVRLGWPAPIFWKRIRIDAIRATRVVTYRPLLDANGWGLRFGRFDGRFTIYWNARGNRGVLIDTDKQRYVVGSQRPEDLNAHIEWAMREGNR